MPQSRFTTYTAHCGHQYESYRCVRQVRTWCPDCVQAMVDGFRAARLDVRPPRRKFWVSRKRRLAIYERDGWVCQLCFEPVDPTLEAHTDFAASLDHIECRAWADEPDDSDSNLRLAHRWCNAVRGDERKWTASDFVSHS